MGRSICASSLIKCQANFIGLIDNSLTILFGQIYIAQQVLESIDETTDPITACDGAIMASKKMLPSEPGKKAEAKTSKLVKPTKAFRSAEFIEDSDEEAPKAVRKKQTPKAVTASKKPPRPTAGESVTKSSKKRKLVSPSPEKEESTQSDTEDVRSSHGGESSENEDSSSAQDGSPTPAEPKETASRPATKSAAVEDSVGKSQLNKLEAPGKGSVRRTPSPRTASTSESEEESESSAGEDESGIESESSDHILRKGPRKESPTQKPVTSTQEKVIFEPPPGFEPASISVHPSSQAMDMFSPTNLARKEIWHISAPSSVPISSVKELSQQSILSKSPILTYKGSNYGLIPSSSTDGALLLPSAEDNDYKSHNAATIKSFHLQQIVSLPHHVLSPGKSSNQSAPIPQAYKRTPREQPKGLKMRYHPFGVVDTSDDDITSEGVSKAPQFRVPGAVDATPAEKRKRVSVDDGAQSPTVSSSKVKSKKAKVRQEAPANEHDEMMDIDTVSQPASQKQDALKTKANGISENHTPKSAKPKKTKLKATDKKPEHPPPQPSASQSLLPADIAAQAEIIMPEEVVTNGASAIEITASEEKKMKRKRRKEEAARAVEKENVAKADVDVKMRDAETPSGKSEGQSATTPGKSSAQKEAHAANGEMEEVEATPQQESKEERRKRKEEKRKRKREAAGEV